MFKLPKYTYFICSKVMFKIFQARLQQFMNRELPDIQAGFRKDRGTRGQYAEVDVFLEFSCFLCDLTDVGNLTSGSSVFSKSSLNIWKFTVHVLLKSGLEILNITVLMCEMSAILQ